MITITPAAAEQIRKSAQQNKTQGMALRIAATRNQDNSIHYGMGFDDAKENDTVISSTQIKVIVSADSAELLKNTVVDFVALEPDKFEFIFMNPNDPDYKQPE